MQNESSKIFHGSQEISRSPEEVFHMETAVTREVNTSYEWNSPTLETSNGTQIRGRPIQS